MNQLPAGGGAQAPVQYRIEVDDQGTPAFRRFGREAQAALQGVDAQSRAAFGATGKAAAAMGEKVDFNRQQVQHLQHAFGIMGFHLASAGAQASKATSAFAGLALHGFNPLSLAIAGLAAGLGVLAMKHHEAEEAAEKHAAKEKELYDQARQNQVEVRGLRNPAAAAEDLRDRLAQVEALRQGVLNGIRVRMENLSSRRDFSEAEMLGGVRAPAGNVILGGATRDELEAIRTHETDRTALQNALTRIQGAKASQAVTEDEKRLMDEAIARTNKYVDALTREAEAIERANKEHDEFSQSLAEAQAARHIDEEVEAQVSAAEASLAEIKRSEDIRKKLEEEAAARGKLVEAYESQAARAKGLAAATGELDRQLLELKLDFFDKLGELGPGATFDERTRLADAFRVQSQAARDEDARRFAPDAQVIGERRGKGVANALIGDFNQELTRAVLDHRADFERLARSFTQTLTEAFFSALTDATIQKPLEALFSSFFTGLAGAAGAAGGVEAGAPGVVPLAGSGAAPSQLVVQVESAPALVVADESAAKVPQRTKRAFVLAGLSSGGVRGFRAPA